MLRLATILLLGTAGAQGLSLPVGTPIPQVVCAADTSQSYALYLPSNYSADRAWPVVFGFDPGGRGANPVDRYQAAAEKYGYIVVGSNNSRNGLAETAKVVSVLTTDVLSRFRVDPRRVYTAGMSGGARVALGVALGSGAIAGVIASSAAYPDDKTRKTLAFPLFMTAGTEDFNHLEMRTVDRDLTSPHHLTIFEGGHTWLSSQLAMEAIEWMEVQAMKSGAAPHNDAELDQILAKRTAAADAASGDAARYLALQSLAGDFKGLRDLTEIAARADALAREKTVRAALKRDRDEDERELRMLIEVRSAEARLGAEDGRLSTLTELRQLWKELAEKAKKPADSPERRLARRVLSNLSASVASTDAEYLKIIAEYRLGRGGR